MRPDIDATCGPAPVVGVILAGGRGRRMGGRDKPLLELAGKPLLEHVILRARPQVRCLALNANGDPARFAAFGLPVVPDGVPDYAGPLAGVLAGMDWARATAPACSWLATFPADTPFVPRDLVCRLVERLSGSGAELAVAESAGRRQPLAALWPVSFTERLRRALVEEGERKVGAWQARFRVAAVEFGTDPVDPFFNVNAPGDLEKAARLLGREEPA